MWRGPASAAKRRLPDSCYDLLNVLLIGPSDGSCIATENLNVVLRTTRRDPFPQGHPEKHSKPVSVWRWSFSCQTFRGNLMNPSQLCGFCQSPLKHSPVKPHCPPITPYARTRRKTNVPSSQEQVCWSIIAPWCCIASNRSIRMCHRVGNMTRQPRYTSAEPRPTLIDLSSSVLTTLTMTLAAISSWPIKNDFLIFSDKDDKP